ncbi:hypothetical protein R3P38DRAFT_2890108 [Favolaschia claudopus]|uniref:Arrestin-like N-terminal domain-containing protein n=1 Tax=Favolaschia claudopus TaxID=2862362 RepID=A0AAW0CTS7_9AGAR
MCSSECPPLYSSICSSSCSSPAYSPMPAPDEHTLEHSRRQTRCRGSGMCIKCVGNTTLVVLDQEDNTEHPRVNGGTLIRGAVLLENTENIKSVTLQIDGLLETLPLPASYMATPLVSITSELYRNDDLSLSCPSNLSFSHPFPSKFKYRGELHYLPPSLHMTFNNFHFVKCAYQITVTVVSARHRRASFLTKTNQVHLELIHRPRSRPSQPLLPNPSLVDTVKICPEEWDQCPRAVSIASLPVLCDLFLPSIRVFCVEDQIPFHLQLGTMDQVHTQSFTTSAPPIVKVHLIRKVSMDAGNRPAHRTIMLGEASLQRLASNNDSPATLNWQGEVQCQNPESAVATFSCGEALSVSDMLVVEISPPHECPVHRTSFAFPIKLTTHRWDSYF